MFAVRRVAHRPLNAVRWASQGLPKAAHPPNPHLPKTEKNALYEMEVKDFRPPWVYTGTKLVNYLVCPGIFLYAMFVYDWGERDHVFQAPRKWLKQQQEAFFSLSPEQQKLVDSTEKSTKPE